MDLSKGLNVGRCGVNRAWVLVGAWNTTPSDMDSIVDGRGRSPAVVGADTDTVTSAMKTEEPMPIGLSIVSAILETW
jgi:hypothetical protein